MKRTILTLSLICILAFASTAMAVPTLQLDITDGWYDPGEETVMIDRSEPFELIALLTTDDPGLLDYTYWVSIALVPKETPPGGDYGTITFDGEVFDVTGDMEYGTPPIALADNADLPSHGIYDTYFLEYEISFNANATTETYNVQPGEEVDEDNGEADKITYFLTFDVDARDLLLGYDIHFDLYSTDVIIDEKTGEPITVLADFAPFSHDAETTVPEPSSLLLLGIGMVGVVFVRRKRKLA